MQITVNITPEVEKWLRVACLANDETPEELAGAAIACIVHADVSGFFVGDQDQRWQEECAALNRPGARPGRSRRKQPEHAAKPPAPEAARCGALQLTTGEVAEAIGAFEDLISSHLEAGFGELTGEALISAVAEGNVDPEELEGAQIWAGILGKLLALGVDVERASDPASGDERPRRFIVRSMKSGVPARCFFVYVPETHVAGLEIAARIEGLAPAAFIADSAAKVARGILDTAAESTGYGDQAEKETSALFVATNPA